MIVYDREIKACWMCPYYDAPKSKLDEGWLCHADSHEIEESHKNSTIHKDCPFNKPITKEVIESFGFKYIMTSYNGYYKKDNIELSYTYDKRIQIKTCEGITFLGIINNPEELKFILKRLNIL